MGQESAEDNGDDEMSIADEVVESVMDLIDAMDTYAPITRGALGSGIGLVCEAATSSVDSVFLDKNQYIFLDLTFNGKHPNLQILTTTLNDIQDNLTRLHDFPSGNGWEIVDISHGSPPLPTLIGREDNIGWIMASAIIVKYYRKDEEA